MQLLCSIQYRVVKENADDAFYELQNPQEQIQAYVFDGIRSDLHRRYFALHFIFLFILMVWVLLTNFGYSIKWFVLLSLK